MESFRLKGEKKGLNFQGSEGISWGIGWGDKEIMGLKIRFDRVGSRARGIRHR